MRERVERRFKYFIRLGKPLWRMSERYDSRIADRLGINSSTFLTS